MKHLTTTIIAITIVIIVIISAPKTNHSVPIWGLSDIVNNQAPNVIFEQHNNILTSDIVEYHVLNNGLTVVEVATGEGINDTQVITATVITYENGLWYRSQLSKTFQNVTLNSVRQYISNL